MGIIGDGIKKQLEFARKLPRVKPIDVIRHLNKKLGLPPPPRLPPLYESRSKAKLTSEERRRLDQRLVEVLDFGATDEEGFAEITREAIALIDEGANVNAQAPGNTCNAIGNVSFFGYTEVLRRLVQGGADPNKPDNVNRTPLMQASMGNTPQFGSETEILEILLNEGARIDYCTDPIFNCVNALFFAAEDGRTERVTFLLGKGADAFYENTEGQTALDVARNTEDDDLLVRDKEGTIAVLEEHMEKQQKSKTSDGQLKEPKIIPIVGVEVGKKIELTPSCYVEFRKEEDKIYHLYVRHTFSETFQCETIATLQKGEGWKLNDCAFITDEGYHVKVRVDEETCKTDFNAEIEPSPSFLSTTALDERPELMFENTDFYGHGRNDEKPELMVENTEVYNLVGKDEENWRHNLDGSGHGLKYIRGSEYVDKETGKIVGGKIHYSLISSPRIDHPEIPYRRNFSLEYMCGVRVGEEKTFALGDEKIVTVRATEKGTEIIEGFRKRNGRDAQTCEKG